MIFKSSGFLTIRPWTLSVTTFLFCSPKKKPNSGLALLNFEVSRSHNIRHTHAHTNGRTPLNEGSVSPEAATYTTYNKRMSRHIHTLSEIQTRDTNCQAASYLSFKPHGHWDRLLSLLQGIKVLSTEKEQDIWLCVLVSLPDTYL